MVRNGSHPSLAYIADIDRSGSLNLTLIEFFEENNETDIYLSQTPIYANSHYFGVIGNVSQISPEDMPLYDILWPYLTNEKVIAIFGPYPPSPVPLKDITTGECSGKYCMDESSDLIIVFEAQPFTYTELINTTVPTTTPLQAVTKTTLITSTELTTTENVMIATHSTQTS